MWINLAFICGGFLLTRATATLHRRIHFNVNGIVHFISSRNWDAGFYDR